MYKIKSNSTSLLKYSEVTLLNILSRATFPGAPSYGGVRAWVEGSQTRGDRALAGASNLLGYKEYTQNTYTIFIAIKLPTNNAKYTPYLILILIEN